VVRLIFVAAIPLGNVDEIDGTPAPDVIKTPLLAVAISPIVPVGDAPFW
jgi:hypothetical protein